MSKKQTRRSISVRGTTYEALRQYCELHERSMSDLVEEKLATVLSQAPLATAARPHRARTIAAKLVRAPAAPKPIAPSPDAKSKSAGRPAPTPARELVPERVNAPKGDYRVIRF